jgi:hypothetical protein
LQLFWYVCLIGLTGVKAREVPDAIQYGMTKVRLQRTLVPRFECVDSAQGFDHHILYEVRRLEHPAHRRGHSSVRPSTQRWRAAFNEPLKRRSITAFGQGEEFNRGVGW